mmetsp:Transcript_44836/g.95425  ORF Transcript_44836/g.95425 Transcript_44836/m.95425 type:complete len:449 (+) Transcript_44836:171-1517(+)|eukprot:CAMPEP_0172546738 /NCGR_PEP_ID=MMETSP1067-20121228/16427_1 /TAXON_ID=265564 ORGANISM="Thalassiosira punctigera, Strain Tpunct2005C2" /NCGR_SAMPLE_ID=MMETSP1067 /ASSEMBLY_ACC=CAM_ASM_000444 /LENGTH=448 /DNA_ID=CAMNT_0013333707 /DNA_START=124 /DNA_END=1470 /DNA_ORIENTATION=+
MGMEIVNLNLMADQFQPTSYGSATGQHDARQPSVSPSTTDSNSQPASQIDPRQNDFIASELRRMQRVREEENNALMQLLSRQQQMAGAADSGSSSSQFNSIANPPTSSFGSSTQMNGFMPQSLMNNRDMNNMGMGSLNSMNSGLRLNNPNSALGLQLSNLMPSSLMNGGMNMNGMDSMVMNHQMNMNNMQSAAANSSISHFNKADLPFDQQTMNFTSQQSFASNQQTGANMDSLGGMNDFIKNSGSILPPNGASNSFNMLPAEQPPPHEDPGWEEQYKALREYHLRFGNCKVPARFKANPKLGRWVMTQRRQFTLLMQGFPSALTAERIRRLEALGFTWSVRPEPVSTWNKKFQELKAYKATYGNCMVPQRYQANTQLGTWVHTQRRQYKLMSEGKKSSMTKEKADALDSIGFFWAAKHSTSTARSKSPVDAGSTSDSSDQSERGKSA